MSVHYKFKSSLSYDTVTFDGLHISVDELKKSILQQKKIGKNSDFELQITNAQTKELYTDDAVLIPKNTSVIVARIPIAGQQKKTWERSDSPSVFGNKGSYSPSDQVSEKLSKIADLLNANATEDDKIKAMMSQSSHDYDPSKYTYIKNSYNSGPPPPTYVCHRCGKSGHWIKNCPTNSNPDVKRSTGIPRSFMVTVDGPGYKGALMTSSGEYAVPAIDHETYKDISGKSVVKKEEPEEEEEKEPVPEELLCLICKNLLIDAVLIPCCGNSYCDECIRQLLLDSENHECPTCHETDVSPDNLIPTRSLRTAVKNFKNRSSNAILRRRSPMTQNETKVASSITTTTTTSVVSPVSVSTNVAKVEASGTAKVTPEPKSVVEAIKSESMAASPVRSPLSEQRTSDDLNVVENSISKNPQAATEENTEDMRSPQSDADRSGTPLADEVQTEPNTSDLSEPPNVATVSDQQRAIQASAANEPRPPGISDSSVISSADDVSKPSVQVISTVTSRGPIVPQHHSAPVPPYRPSVPPHPGQLNGLRPPRSGDPNVKRPYRPTYSRPRAPYLPPTNVPPPGFTQQPGSFNWPPQYQPFHRMPPPPPGALLPPPPPGASLPVPPGVAPLGFALRPPFSEAGAGYRHRHPVPFATPYGGEIPAGYKYNAADGTVDDPYAEFNRKMIEKDARARRRFKREFTRSRSRSRSWSSGSFSSRSYSRSRSRSFSRSPHRSFSRSRSKSRSPIRYRHRSKSFSPRRHSPAYRYRRGRSRSPLPPPHSPPPGYRRSPPGAYKPPVHRPPPPPDYYSQAYFGGPYYPPSHLLKPTLKKYPPYLDPAQQPQRYDQYYGRFVDPKFDYRGRKGQEAPHPFNDERHNKYESRMRGREYGKYVVEAHKEIEGRREPPSDSRDRHAFRSEVELPRERAPKYSTGKEEEHERQKKVQRSRSPKRKSTSPKRSISSSNNRKDVDKLKKKKHKEKADGDVKADVDVHERRELRERNESVERHAPKPTANSTVSKVSGAKSKDKKHKHKKHKDKNKEVADASGTKKRKKNKSKATTTDTDVETSVKDKLPSAAGDLKDGAEIKDEIKDDQIVKESEKTENKQEPTVPKVDGENLEQNEVAVTSEVKTEEKPSQTPPAEYVPELSKWERDELEESNDFEIEVDRKNLRESKQSLPNDIIQRAENVLLLKQPKPSVLAKTSSEKKHEKSRVVESLKTEKENLKITVSNDEDSSDSKAEKSRKHVIDRPKFGESSRSTRHVDVTGRRSPNRDRISKRHESRTHDTHRREMRTEKERKSRDTGRTESKSSPERKKTHRKDESVVDKRKESTNDKSASSKSKESSRERGKSQATTKESSSSDKKKRAISPIIPPSATPPVAQTIIHDEESKFIPDYDGSSDSSSGKVKESRSKKRKTSSSSESSDSTDESSAPQSKKSKQVDSNDKKHKKSKKYKKDKKHKKHKHKKSKSKHK